jgi:Uma2 family endonuclease
MSLDVFDHAIAKEGFRYELGNGVIEVSEIEPIEHGRQVEALLEQLTAYQQRHGGVIDYLSGSSDAKLLIAAHESERHPDVMVYLSDPPDVADLWSIWIPKLVVEIVSQRSSKRDYEVKPGEYLELGIFEYWIVDSIKSQLTALVRWRGQWKTRVLKPTQKISTPLLPGFTLDLKRVFAAAKKP